MARQQFPWESDPIVGTPQESKTTGQARQEEAKGDIAPRKERSDVEHTETTTAGQAIKNRVDAATADAQIKEANAKAAKAEADLEAIHRQNAAGGLPPEKATELRGNLAQLDDTQKIVDDLRQQYLKHFAGKGVSSVAEYAPKILRPENGVFDDTAGTLLTKISQAQGLTSRQFDTPKEQTMFLAPLVPKSTDTDEQIEHKLRTLENMVTAGRHKYQTMLSPTGTAPADTAPEVPYDVRWLTGDQENAVQAFVAGKSPTAEGYANLLERFAKENGRSFPREEALRVGATIEAHRKAGGTYGPGVAYAAHSPVPTEGEGLTGSVTDTGEGYAPDAQAPSSGSHPPAPEGSDELSWGSAGLQALGNAPSSLAHFVGDTVGGVVDLMQRPDDTSSVAGLANHLLPPGVRQMADQALEIGQSALGAFGVTNADPTLAQAIGKHYADQYGSVDAFKHTLAKDPATVLADLSTIVTGVGGLGVKGAELAGATSNVAKAARLTRVAGRAIDPVSLAGGAVEGASALASRYLPQAAKDFGNAALSHLTQRYPAAIAAFPSGIGGETVQEAVGAGRQRSLRGPNARSAAFTGQMRDQRPASDIMDELDAGVKRLRENASRRYQDDIAPITRDPTQLDFAPIQQQVARLRPKSFGLYTGKNSGAEAAWQQVDDLVRQHADLIASDPAQFATPAALDTFKQHLYDVASQYAEGGDRSAARIAKGAYRAISDTISQQAPDYARVMKDYSQAQEHLGQVQSTLTSGGRNRNTDASIRRLQAILRRNDPGHAGQLIDDVNAQPNSELLASVAGRSGEPILPGGLRGAIGAGVTLSPSGIAALTSGADGLTSMIPAQIAALATTSPRLVSETAYGLGRLGGGAERLAKGVWGAYENSPAATLAGADALATRHRMSEEEQRKRMLLKRYGLSTDASTQDALSQYARGQ